MSELADFFGQQIAGVRDGILREWEGILDGRMRSPTAVRIREKLSNLTPDEFEVLKKELLPDIVDTSIHNFLSFLESVDEVRLSNETKTINGNILADPDGLTIPLFGPEGWIARFSKKPSHFAD